MSNSYTVNPYMQNQQTPAQVANNMYAWVVNEEQARSFPVVPGSSMVLMDSVNSVFYVKSVDLSGMTIGFRIFDYQERPQQEQIASQFVTREEFDKLMGRLDALDKRNSSYKKNNGGNNVNA